jgi:nucleoside-diphosphate-sugar epimerase
LHDDRRQNDSWVLLTGATGFVGGAVLAELIARGRRVLCLVRAATPDRARRRIVEALHGADCDAQALLESGRLAVLRGDLLRPNAGLDEGVIEMLRDAVVSVVHAAGSTVFDARHDGEPARTNIEATREIFRLAVRCNCPDWHFVSTAYVSGQCAQAAESLTSKPPPFRNDYERSKWQAEQDAARAAERSSAILTIYRPSIVVGNSRTGRALRFAGIYYLFRATSLMARYAGQHDDIDRYKIPLRIRADAGACTNLICTDDLASLFGELFNNPGARGGVYHLTHPAPPTNEQIKRVLETRYDIGGGRFIGRASPGDDNGRSSFEEIFEDMTASLAPYLFDSPEFGRACVDRFVSHRPGAWTDDKLHRLIDYAESVGWRASVTPRDPGEDMGGCGAYFERFLPEHIPLSQVGSIRKLDIDARFIVEDEPEGDWWCRFHDGQLIEVM